MGIVEGIIEKLSEYFVINSNLCARVRHKNSVCADCMDVCPEDAVRITGAGGKVLVDWEKCVDCGRCMSVCKNGVFSMRKADYGIMSSSVAEQLKDDSKTVSFACANAKNTGNITKLPSLAYVNHGLIINTAASGAKSLFFIHGECADCRMQGCLPFLNKEINFSSKIFSLCGKECSLSITSESIKKEPQKKRSSLRDRLGSTADIKLNRREFFSFVKDSTRNTVSKTLHYMTENDSQKEKTVFDAKTASVLNVSYLESLKALGGDILIKNMQKNGLFPNLHINTEKCIKCGICSRMCPFSALETITDTIKGRTVITEIKVNADRCTGCSLCVISCPYGAVSTD